MGVISGVRTEACFPGCSLRLSVSPSASLPALFHRHLGDGVSPLPGAAGAGAVLGCSYQGALQLPSALPPPPSQNRGVQTGLSPQAHTPSPLGLAEADKSDLGPLFSAPAHCYPSTSALINPELSVQQREVQWGFSQASDPWGEPDPPPAAAPDRARARQDLTLRRVPSCRDTGGWAAVPWGAGRSLAGGQDPLCSLPCG